VLSLDVQGKNSGAYRLNFREENTVDVYKNQRSRKYCRCLKKLIIKKLEFALGKRCRYLKQEAHGPHRSPEKPWPYRYIFPISNMNFISICPI
jgi:hypothetical protein